MPHEDGGAPRVARLVPKRLRPLRSGGLLWAASDPAFGMLSAAGEPRALGTPVTSEYRGAWEGVVHLSADGSVLAAGTAYRGTKPGRLAIAERR